MKIQQWLSNASPVPGDLCCFRTRMTNMSISQGAEVIEGAVGHVFAQRVFMLFAALAGLSLLISLGERVIGSRIVLGGHSDRVTPHEIVIGNDVIVVPENMIRLPEQRRGGEAQRLDLYVSWPRLAGFNADETELFNGTKGAPSLLFISIEERVMSRDMAGRYEPIYKFLTEGAGTAGPLGLTRYKLQVKAGYLNEALYVSPEQEDGHRFVARCIVDSTEHLIAPCERDIDVGTNLSAVLRFPATLLEDWRALDASVPIFIGGIVRTPPELKSL
jgi:hypothetical protein